VQKRVHADSRVGAAGAIEKQCLIAYGRVEIATRVVHKRD
jgi:hypothetical protein